MDKKGPRLNRASVGESQTDYTSLDAWDAGEQGAGFDCNVAVLSRDKSLELKDFLERAGEFITVPTLFISETGQRLAYAVAGEVEDLGLSRVEAQGSEAAPSQIDEAIEEFISERFGTSDSEIHAEVRTVMRLLARKVAEGCLPLSGVEWRDLERILAEVFEGLGFSVVLTPPSKDGGKDLVLTCKVSSERWTYVVEVKHWNSGKRVGDKVVMDLTEVVCRGSRAGGLILSTSGFSGSGFRALAEVEQMKVFGRTDDAVMTLCRLHSSQERSMIAASDVWQWLTDGAGTRSLPLVE